MSLTRLILCSPDALRMRLPGLSPEEIESHCVVINAKMVDEAVKRCETPVLVVETHDSRVSLAELYNSLWDAALCHKKTSLDCRVVAQLAVEPSAKRFEQDSPELNVESMASLLEDEINMRYFLFDNPRQILPSLEVVALGGTFDRLHNGHKKLLSIAVQVATQKVIVGVTADSMLKNKKNAQLIQDVKVRLERTKEFCDSIGRPGLVIEVLVIDDPWGPAVSRAHVHGIVVSSETLHGAKVINDMRAEKGFRPLLPVLVLRSNQYVLSSTFVRTLL